ncbi:MAG: hypothetical protein ACRCXC_01575 [Legionella sp.]
MLEKELNIPGKNISYVILYDTKHEKNLIDIEQKQSNSWMYQKLSQFPSPLTSQKLITSVPLNNLDGFSIRVTGRNQSMRNNFCHNELFLSLDILVLSIFYTFY